MLHPIPTKKKAMKPTHLVVLFALTTILAVSAASSDGQHATIQPAETTSPDHPLSPMQQRFNRLRDTTLQEHLASELVKMVAALETSRFNGKIDEKKRQERRKEYVQKSPHQLIAAIKLCKLAKENEQESAQSFTKKLDEIFACSDATALPSKEHLAAAGDYAAELAKTKSVLLKKMLMIPPKAKGINFETLSDEQLMKLYSLFGSTSEDKDELKKSVSKILQPSVDVQLATKIEHVCNRHHTLREKLRNSAMEAVKEFYKAIGIECPKKFLNDMSLIQLMAYFNLYKYAKNNASLYDTDKLNEIIESMVALPFDWLLDEGVVTLYQAYAYIFYPTGSPFSSATEKVNAAIKEHFKEALLKSDTTAASTTEAHEESKDHGKAPADATTADSKILGFATGSSESTASHTRFSFRTVASVAGVVVVCAIAAILYKFYQNKEKSDDFDDHV